MTSAQPMPSGRCRSLPAASLLSVLIAASCTQRLHEPTTLWSPYESGQLWAVAPFTNESGTSVVDGIRVADLFTQQLQSVRGITTIPVNRVLLAMRVAEIQSITNPQQARELIDALNVDGLIVGTVTAYDPYPPPTMGAAVQLLVSRGFHDPGNGFDPQALSRAASGDDVSPGQMTSSVQAVAEASGVFDARNHLTLAWLGEYSRGRTEPDAAFGADIYLMDMELYTQFVSYRLIHDLLSFAQARVTPNENQALQR